MPPIVDHALLVLSSALPVLVAFAAFTTALNQAVQRLAASKYPRLAHVVNTISVDVVALVKALSAFLPSSKPGDQRGVATGNALGWILVFVFAVVFAGLAILTGCNPAEIQAAKSAAEAELPVLAQVDAIGKVLANVVGWCDAHGATPETVGLAKHAIETKDLPGAADLVRSLLEENAKAGVPIPSEVIALVQTAEGAIAAQSIQDGMRALSAGGGPNK